MQNGTDLQQRNLPQTSDFRSYLQAEIVRRCKLNPNYSLRAFANLLRIDSSTLSQILRGKRTITPKLTKRLAVRLGLSPVETEKFIPAIKSRRALNESTQPKSFDLTVEAYQLLADWYHLPIMELCTVQGFKKDPKWIAKRLGITATEANIAVERLFRLEILVEDEYGNWKPGAPFISTTGNPFTDVALRKVQSQILGMSLKALEEVPIEERDHSGVCMAINSKRLPEAKALIKKFRRELCDYLQQDIERDMVYQLGVFFYPLTVREKESSNEN